MKLKILGCNQCLNVRYVLKILTTVQRKKYKSVLLNHYRFVGLVIVLYRHYENLKWISKLKYKKHLTIARDVIMVCCVHCKNRNFETHNKRFVLCLIDQDYHAALKWRGCPMDAFEQLDKILAEMDRIEINSLPTSGGVFV